MLSQPKKTPAYKAKPAPAKPQKPRVIKLRNPKKRDWIDITNEANRIGANHLIWTYGFSPLTQEKMKQQKKFPKLAAEIEAICGKDRFIEYIKAEQRAARLKIVIFLGLIGLTAVFHQLAIPAMLVTICLRWMFEPDYRECGFSEDEAEFYKNHSENT